MEDDRIERMSEGRGWMDRKIHWLWDELKEREGGVQCTYSKNE